MNRDELNDDTSEVIDILINIASSYWQTQNMTASEVQEYVECHHAPEVLYASFERYGYRFFNVDWYAVARSLKG